jgi:uncharacterized membrane protein
VIACAIIVPAGCDGRSPLAPAAGAPEDPCDQPDEEFENPFVTDFPSTPSLTIRREGIRVEQALVAPFPAGSVLPDEARAAVREALADVRSRRMALCHRGAASFDHTLQLVSDPDTAFGIVGALVEDARAEGFDVLRFSVFRPRTAESAD